MNTYVLFASEIFFFQTRMNAQKEKKVYVFQKDLQALNEV